MTTLGQGTPAILLMMNQVVFLRWASLLTTLLLKRLTLQSPGQAQPLQVELPRLIQPQQQQHVLYLYVTPALNIMVCFSLPKLTSIVLGVGNCDS
jgi:hypothetical protein